MEELNNIWFTSGHFISYLEQWRWAWARALIGRQAIDFGDQLQNMLTSNRHHISDQRETSRGEAVVPLMSEVKRFRY